jgi:hypothetical protein
MGEFGIELIQQRFGFCKMLLATEALKLLAQFDQRHGAKNRASGLQTMCSLIDRLALSRNYSLPDRINQFLRIH